MRASDHSGIRAATALDTGLEELLGRVDSLPGVDARQLRAGDRLDVRTQNSLYSLILEEPGAGAGILISDSHLVEGRVAACVVGSSLSGRGSWIKVGWVLPGFKLVLSLGDKELLTSPVRDVSLNGHSLVEPSASLH